MISPTCAKVVTVRWVSNSSPFSGAERNRSIAMVLLAHVGGQAALH